MNDLISLEKIAQWQRLKTLVLDSVSSPITKRVYNMALDEFMGWFQQAPRPGFTKATVSAWRVSLEDRRLHHRGVPTQSTRRRACSRKPRSCEARISSLPWSWTRTAGCRQRTARTPLAANRSRSQEDSHGWQIEDGCRHRARYPSERYSPGRARWTCRLVHPAVW